MDRITEIKARVFDINEELRLLGDSFDRHVNESPDLKNARDKINELKIEGEGLIKEMLALQQSENKKESK